MLLRMLLCLTYRVPSFHLQSTGLFLASRLTGGMLTGKVTVR